MLDSIISTSASYPACTVFYPPGVLQAAAQLAERDGRYSGRGASSASEHKRRRHCQRRAVTFLYAWHDGCHSFEQVYTWIVKRWPVSCAGEEFRQHLHDLWEKEAEANRKWRCERMAERMEARGEGGNNPQA